MLISWAFRISQKAQDDRIGRLEVRHADVEDRLVGVRSEIMEALREMTQTDTARHESVRLEHKRDMESLGDIQRKQHEAVMSRLDRLIK